MFEVIFVSCKSVSVFVFRFSVAKAWNSTQVDKLVFRGNKQ